jgi:hypothetical protein
MNFFNSVAIYAFVFLFLVVSMESKKMSPAGHDSMTFISGRYVTLFYLSVKIVAP